MSTLVYWSIFVSVPVSLHLSFRLLSTYKIIDLPKKRERKRIHLRWYLISTKGWTKESTLCLQVGFSGATLTRDCYWRGHLEENSMWGEWWAVDVSIQQGVPQTVSGHIFHFFLVFPGIAGALSSSYSSHLQTYNEAISSSWICVNVSVHFQIHVVQPLISTMLTILIPLLPFCHLLISTEAITEECKC